MLFLDFKNMHKHHYLSNTFVILCFIFNFSNIIMIFIFTLTIISCNSMFNIECYEYSGNNFYIKFTKLSSKALCGSYKWLVAVKSIKKMQN